MAKIAEERAGCSENMSLDPRNTAKCGHDGGLRADDLHLETYCLHPEPKGNAHPPSWAGGHRGRHG